MEIEKELLEKAEQLAGERLGLDPSMLGSVAKTLGLGNAGQDQSDKGGGEDKDSSDDEPSDDKSDDDSDN